MNKPVTKHYQIDFFRFYYSLASGTFIECIIMDDQKLYGQYFCKKSGCLAYQYRYVNNLYNPSKESIFTAFMIVYVKKSIQHGYLWFIIINSFPSLSNGLVTQINVTVPVLTLINFLNLIARHLDLNVMEYWINNINTLSPIIKIISLESSSLKETIL